MVVVTVNAIDGSISSTYIQRWKQVGERFASSLLVLYPYPNRTLAMVDLNATTGTKRLLPSILAYGAEVEHTTS